MRWSGRLVAALALGLPWRAPAQTVQRTDLVGTWVWTTFRPAVAGQYAKPLRVDTLTLRADSTWARSTDPVGSWFPKEAPAEFYQGPEVQQSEPFGFGHRRSTGTWRLIGDSLWFGDPAATRTIQGITIPAFSPARARLADGQLTLERLLGRGTIAPDGIRGRVSVIETYERSSPPWETTAAPPPGPSADAPSLAGAGLIGSWELLPQRSHEWMRDSTVTRHTVTFRPDGTCTEIKTRKDGRVMAREGHWRVRGAVLRQLWRRDRAVLARVPGLDTASVWEERGYGDTRTLAIQNDILASYREWDRDLLGNLTTPFAVYRRLALAPPVPPDPSPTTPLAQTDLVGTWTGTAVAVRTLRLDADGTMFETVKYGNMAVPQTDREGAWYLTAGDSLWWGDPNETWTVAGNGETVQAHTPQKVVLDRNRLGIGVRWDSTSLWTYYRGNTPAP